jgi:hypothetical protein
MISTLVEQVVHCKIIRVIRPMPKEGHENERTLPYKVLCKLENGLTGVLQEMHFADSEEDKIRFQSTIREDMTSELSARARCPRLCVSGLVTLLPSAWLPATVLSCLFDEWGLDDGGGFAVSCVVTEVKYEEFAVELSHKDSFLRRRGMPERHKAREGSGLRVSVWVAQQHEARHEPVTRSEIVCVCICLVVCRSVCLSLSWCFQTNNILIDWYCRCAEQAMGLTGKKEKSRDKKIKVGQ